MRAGVKSTFALFTDFTVFTVKPPLKNLPIQYIDALEALFFAAKENLEIDGTLFPFAFLGNLSTQQVMPLSYERGQHRVQGRFGAEDYKDGGPCAAEF